MARMRYLLLLPFAVFSSQCLAFADKNDPWPCDSDSDCKKNERCRVDDMANKHCAPADVCSDFISCDPGWVCVQERCVHQQCTEQDTSACQGYGCTSPGFCNTLCSTAWHCAEGFGCLDGRCVPATCSDSPMSECGGLLCVERVCLTSCASSADCFSGLTCVRGACELVEGANVPCAGTHCRYGQCIDGMCVIAGSLCESMVCGDDQGYPCGECGPKEVCTETFVCADACGSRECGTFFGVYCGGCDAPRVCSPEGMCTDP